jgi:NADP-dependent 3-hydroxy acid dehydrogenase YdfG
LITLTSQGSGIGRETAKAFVTTGAGHLVLVGRELSKLQETKSQIAGDIKITAFAADVTDGVAMQNIADAIGTWHVLIMNAGYIPSPCAAANADVDDYWKSYEVRSNEYHGKFRLNAYIYSDQCEVSNCRGESFLPDSRACASCNTCYGQ